MLIDDGASADVQIVFAEDERGVASVTCDQNSNCNFGFSSTCESYTMNLSPEFFDLGDLRFRRTLCHEIFHTIGFSDYREDLDSIEPRGCLPQSRISIDSRDGVQQEDARLSFSEAAAINHLYRPGYQRP